MRCHAGTCCFETGVPIYTEKRHLCLKCRSDSKGLEIKNAVPPQTERHMCLVGNKYRDFDIFLN
jgi:hypothetical protein